ncbi:MULTISPECIES: hypothetical protein [unclassified Variovorax]|uniref:hypothetical protein n=1 Tax=unclassified Variovorax TaxID=663243 RepID=UPI003F476A34
MPLDPNIILQAGRGVTPLQDPSEMQAKLQQSQLGALQLQQAQRGMADDQAYRQVLQSGVQGADQIAALQKAGLGKQSMDAAKFQTEQQKAQAERGKLVAEGMKNGAGMILANPTEENAIETLSMAQQQYGLPPQMVDSAKAQIYGARNDPNKLRQLAQGWGGDAEKVLGKFTTENLGGTLQTQRTNPATGQTDIAGIQARTQSPDSMASVAQSAANAQMTDARAREQNQIRQQQGRIPSGYEPDPANPGQLRFIVGGPADPNTKPAGGKPLNDTQAKALQFGTRMQVSAEILDKLSNEGVNSSVPGSRLPVVGGVISALQPEERQQLDQAKRDYINAVLRRESGAAISASEFDNAEKQYFPQPGDKPETIKQKKANRDLATRGILAEVPDAENRVSQVRGNPAPVSPAAGLKSKQPPSKTINIGGNEMRAERAPDGKYYVQQNGKWFEVKE